MKTTEFNKKKKKNIATSQDRKKLQHQGELIAKQQGRAFRTVEKDGDWQLVTVSDPNRKQRSAQTSVISAAPQVRRKSSKIKVKTPSSQTAAVRRSQMTLSATPLRLLTVIDGHDVLDYIPKEGSGWISPDGRFVEADYNEHDTVAYDLSKDLYGKHSVMIFEDEGWLRINGGYIMVVTGHGTRIGRGKALTRKQADLLYDHMVAADMEDVEIMIIDKVKGGSTRKEWKILTRNELYD